VETALVHVKNDIDLAIDEGYGVLLLLFDLSSAFDMVDHSILLDRLSTLIGLRGSVLRWIRSYLEGRTQCVSIEGTASSEVPLTTGVPQGSVLGPILFLCYILPLGKVIDYQRVSRHGYADDTQAYICFRLGNRGSLENALATLEACASDIRTWCFRNKLMLNDGKTELLLIAPKSKMSMIQEWDPKVRVGTATIRPSTCVRNLGASFDQHMDMSSQVSSVCKGVYHNIRLIGKIRCHLDKVTCEKVVCALVTSRLDFNNALLSGLPDTLLSRLQCAQNTAARLVSLTRKHEHISPVLQSLHWLPVKKRIDFKLLLMVYKVMHNLSPPEYLVALLPHHTTTRDLRSTSKPLTVTLRWPNKAAGERAFSVRAPRLWNNLCDSLRLATSIDCFKKQLKTHLFSD